MLKIVWIWISGECESDSECPTNQACYNFKCRDPCIDACGQSAQCQARNHGQWLQQLQQFAI